MDQNANSQNQNPEQTIKEQYTALQCCDKILSAAESWITVLCFALMCLIVIIGIIMRFILKIPNPYGEEASRYLMVCGIFLGVSIGVRQRAHLGVTVIVDILPKKLSRVVSMLASLISLAAYIILSVLALQFTKNIYGYGQTSPAMDLPMYAIYMMLFIGIVLSSIRSAMMFWNDYLARKPLLDKVEEGSSW